MPDAVFWDIEAADQYSDFPKQSARLWGGAEVNWITAMSYDATLAFAEAMKRNVNVTPNTIQKTLANDSFAVTGATGTVRFLDNGDRNGKAQLVEIRPDSSSRSGYDFAPIP